MSDRELLELAAKAAGLPVKFVDEYGGTAEVDGFWPCGCDDDDDVLAWWNPLTDDGDALRLAYRLRLVIAPLRTLVGEDYGFAVHPHGRDDLAVVESGTDIASMRLAITRAAAEIGRAMK